MLPIVLHAGLAALWLATTPPSDVPKIVTISAADEASLVEWDRKVSQLLRRGDLKLREEKPTDDGRMREEWFVQVHEGVPVVGTEVWRQAEGKKAVAIEGSIYPSITLNPKPKLSVEEARVVFITLAKGSPGPTQAPALVILPQPDKFVLVYQARVLTGTDLILYSIDAATGEVVASETDPKPPQ
jgi:Zn-dependent metalloprotease